MSHASAESEPTVAGVVDSQSLTLPFQPSTCLPSALLPPSVSLQSSAPSVVSHDDAESDPAFAGITSAMDSPSTASSDLQPVCQQVATTAIIDGVSRNLFMKHSRTGYYGVSLKRRKSRSVYYATVADSDGSRQHLGAFESAIDAAIAVWRRVDEHNLVPFLARPVDTLGACPIGAPAKHKQGKGCHGVQKLGQRTWSDGPIGSDGLPKWRTGDLFCGASACRIEAGLVSGWTSHTRAIDKARKTGTRFWGDAEAIGEEPVITLPNLAPSFMLPSQPSAMDLQPSPTSPADNGARSGRAREARLTSTPSAAPTQPSLLQSSPSVQPSQQSNEAPWPCNVHIAWPAQALTSLPVDLQRLKRAIGQMSRTGKVPLELAKVCYPALMKLLEAVDKADDLYVPTLLGGMLPTTDSVEEGIGELRCDVLARRLEDVARRLRQRDAQSHIADVPVPPPPPPPLSPVATGQRGPSLATQQALALSSHSGGPSTHVCWPSF